MTMTNVKFDSLDSLDDTKYEWTIKVRVIRIWDSYSTRGEKEFKGRNMLLLDDKHDRMHAFIWPSYIDTFENTFEEGKIYSIRNFSVKTYRKETLRCTKYDKQIWLSKYTKVVKIDESKGMDRKIRNIEFDFFDIGDIREMISKQSDNNCLIDIIGVLKDEDLLRQRTYNKDLEQRCIRFTLTDGSASIKTCFWDNLGESFLTELMKTTDTPVVVIVSSCRVNEFKGDPYVSNVGATRFFLNYNHRSVEEMKKRGILPDFNIDQSIMREPERTTNLTIAQLRTLEESYIMKTVMCQVTVRSVKETKYWNYDACSRCQKEIEMIEGKFRCEECKRNIPFPEKRFRICLMAEDETGVAAFILCDREVESVIGKTAFDVIADQELEGKVEEFPNILKIFQGNAYTLTIRINEENVKKNSHTYTVVDMYKGFEINEENNPNDGDFSSGPKYSQNTSVYSFQNSESISPGVQRIETQTPDTGKSTTSNRLKRLNDGTIISIPDLDEHHHVDHHEKSPKPIILKQIKKEKL